MKTLTIELEDEAFEMLVASAAQNGTTPEQMAAACVEPDVRDDQHVVWDAEIGPWVATSFNRREFRRGDVIDTLETGTRGIVIDATRFRLRVAVQKNVLIGFRKGDTIVGPESGATVMDAAPVEGLKVHGFSILNSPEIGRFAPAS